MYILYLYAPTVQTHLNTFANHPRHPLITDPPPYVGLQLIHEEPYIFIINNFLTPEECDAVVDKCETREPKPSVRSTETIVRTSMTSVAKNEEMAGFRCKVMELTNQTDEQLQYTKMTRYEGAHPRWNVFFWQALTTTTNPPPLSLI